MNASILATVDRARVTRKARIPGASACPLTTAVPNIMVTVTLAHLRPDERDTEHQNDETCVNQGQRREEKADVLAALSMKAFSSETS